MQRYLYLVLLFVANSLYATNNLYIYNWSDYIGRDTIKKFTEETDIVVSYNVFDSNEILEAKLFSGNSGYDVVVPSSQFLAKQIRAGSFKELDKSKLPNYENLNVTLLEKISAHDPENKYSIPYLWGTTGIGYNKQKIQEIFDVSHIDSWDYFFDEKNLQKLSSCGVAVLDAPQEIFATTLHYLGEDPNPQKAQDLQVATELLLKLRPHVSYFHSSKFVTDLANGDICFVVGWSGDILQAKMRAIEADNGVEIEYVIPKEGAALFFDVMAIPFDASNTENAYVFLNYLMQPEIIADISSELFYAHANNPGKDFVKSEIKDNNNIYPDDSLLDKLYVFKEQTPTLNRAMVKSWNKIKIRKK